MNEHVPVREIRHQALNMMLAPLVGALEQAGVHVKTLPSVKVHDDEEPTDQFELLLPGGETISGDVTCDPQNGGDTHWHLYVSQAGGTEDLQLLGRVTTYPYPDEPVHAQVLSGHPLLALIGVTGIQTVHANHVTLSDERTVPRLTHEHGGPLVGSTIREEYDQRFWLDEAQLCALQHLPGWIPRDWDGHEGHTEEGIYTRGAEIMLEGRLLSGRALEQMGTLIGRD